MDDFRQSDVYQITWLIRRLFRAMADRAGSYLADIGITTAERAVLEFLYPEEKLTVPEIARRYRVSRQHIQATVNQLYERRLVAEEENPQHRRSSLISLTPKGRKLFGTVAENDQIAIESLFAGIPKQEQTRTRKTLQELLDTLNETGEKQ